MTTEKKNQHYVPKFYLRNFSYQNNGKQIGVYNIENEIYIPRGKLKTQGSKNFFYGYDGVIEDALSDIEGALSGIIKDIITHKRLPSRNTLEHFQLLLFVTLTDLRNPVKINGMKDSLAEIRKKLLELHPDTDVKKLVPDPSHEELVKMHISNSVEMAGMIRDLGYKLFINGTSKPFITSNFPIVKYNQFLENKKWPHSKSGYGLTGLQIFIPINHETILVFFDKDIYKLGDRKKDFHTVINSKSIDDLNKLQFLNCLDTLYFNENAAESYIKGLHAESKRYKKANLTRSELNYLIKEGDQENKRIIEAGYKNFMKINKTDCEINLRIDGLKIHSRGQAHQLNDSLAQLRPHAVHLQENNWPNR